MAPGYCRARNREVEAELPGKDSLSIGTLLCMHKQKNISLSVPLLVSSRHSEDQTCEFPMKKRAEKAMIGNSNKCAEEEKFFLNCNTCFS